MPKNQCRKYKSGNVSHYDGCVGYEALICGDCGAHHLVGGFSYPPGTELRIKDGTPDSKVLVFRPYESEQKRFGTIEDDGEVFANGIVKANDGRFYEAVPVIDETSSGELWGTYLFMPNGEVAVQGDEEFESILEKNGTSLDQLFPYTYFYAGILSCEDFHIGPDGWSR